MIMSDLDYVYLGTLPNFVINQENYYKVKGKVLHLLIILTNLPNWNSIVQKWEGFCLHELIYLDNEF